MLGTKHFSKHKTRDFRWVVLLLGVLLAADIVSYTAAEGLWFAAAKYWQLFQIQLQTQLGLGAIAFSLSAGFLFVNLAQAQKFKYPQPTTVDAASPGGIRLGLLLPVALGLSFLAGIILLYHGQVAASYWQPNLSLYDTSPPLPVHFRPELVWQIGQELLSQLWQLGLLLGLAIALLVFPEPLLSAIAILISLSFALTLSGHWAKVLAYFRPTAFNTADPIFNRDISFYIFTLPIWELLEFWLVGLCSFAIVVVTLVYLLSGDSLSQGKFPGFSSQQQRHLYGLGGCLLLACALSNWLNRYELLYSPRGATYGASYTDISVQLPAYTILSFLALAIAIALLWQAIFPAKNKSAVRNLGLDNGYRSSTLTSSSPFPFSLSPLPLYGLAIYLLIAALALLALPGVVQRTIVQPNELDREEPYIERTIALTRAAYGLDDIEVETFNPQDNLTFADIQQNDLTIRNIRLWDTRPLLQTNRQLQQIRLYYQFSDADVDRYTLISETGERERQQVLIAARELNYEEVPAEAQTWVNEHLIYTHGYGFTMSPVNTVGPGGLPDYFIRGIEQVPSSERIENSIPIGEPRIYYGELTNTYVMTQTQQQELDYPSGSENVYNTYSGRGGVDIGAFWRRLLFAKHLRDWRMLFTTDFTPESKLLYRRNINRRVRAIAPFLRYDRDPYLVVADASEGQEGVDARQEGALPETANPPNYLYWVIDAYTTSDRYPYSDPGDNDFNYIRNSVKVVIDAYHGTVNFYIADEQDPIIATWSKVFPGMFKSLQEMPVSLQAHIRYPQDFFRVQSRQLMTYHMTDPQVFYNREDQWRAPNEIYGDEQQLVEPYYLIIKLPTETTEEFILLRPFTPIQRNNLIAWIAARSDGAGTDSLTENRYGRMLLYRFPKQELVYGPEQIEARINQDPVISQQISLWNRQGSRAIQGNLLVIPLEESLLYVEPIYLEAEQNSLPTLVRVIVAYENRIAMAETLEQALEAIFQPQETTTPAILREVEDEALLEEGVPPSP